MSIEQKLRALAQRWSAAAPAERANAQIYLSELCDALEVEKPRPAGSGYEFEYPVRVVNRDGTETTNFVDLFKREHFILEAKDQGVSADDTILLRKAYGQARAYTAAADGDPPPYAMVLDVGRTLLVWDRWSGTYGGFNAATRINLQGLADNPDGILLLRDIFEDPEERNPNIEAAAVTQEIAEQLAELASALEARGFEQERVARFLIRCVFTMFAEDTDLIPDSPFTHAIDEIGFSDPDEFAIALAGLWRAMDEGSRFGLKKFLRFNGHFFKDQEVLPLTRDDLAILRRAADASWEAVEPSIMGTLLVRALDPAERHKLGAEYTPREFVERVVRPAVEEPIRERWTAVQAEVLQLRSSAGLAERTRRDRDKLAVERLRGFHEWLRGLRFLDPACGSGNFLYVTLAIVKQIELEVLRAIEEITGAPELAVEEVGPWQFHGIEVKLWAREIAELSLWIGYHQWWRRTHGHTQPPEPVLRDTGTLECRDAVLQWDSTVQDVERGRLDPTPRIPHPVTGQLVPDPNARVPYFEHRNAVRAEWPRADFIIGNPPFLGRGKQRDELGDGYVDALREAYANVPDTADYVMYWWYRAAHAVAERRVIRAGLITTNSITTGQNRSVVSEAEAAGARVVWAIADHPWVDEAGAADVRVAMTVISADNVPARLLTFDHDGRFVRQVEVPRLNADLTVHADVASASRLPLTSNEGLSSVGFMLGGRGFVLEPEEAERLLAADARLADVIRPYRNGRDLAGRPRGVYVIDFGLMTEEEARQYPVAYDIVRDRVKPTRDSNPRESYRRYWWRFAEPRKGLRSAFTGLARYIATPETAKHRYFDFVDMRIAPDHSVICIADDSTTLLGLLSSSIHALWAAAAGGRLGVGNDPRYNKRVCFDSFPFADLTPEQAESIGLIAEQIVAHRKDAYERDIRITPNGLYNVIAKLRAAEALTPAERTIHELGACGILRDLHDELDQVVAHAYGWRVQASEADILSGLVLLHDERAAAQDRGTVLWLRPEYQAGQFAGQIVEESLPLAEQEAVRVPAFPAWPSTVIEQIRALQAILSRRALTADEATREFRGARRDIVARHLDTLAVMGEVHCEPNGTYSPVAPT